jgi:4'-phosphopantetheinyl transferase
MNTHFSIKTNSAHLWRVFLPDFHDVETSMASLLSIDEIERANQFRFPIHRQRFILARAFLRKILGLYLQQPPTALLFTYGPQGKPALRNAALQFNVSHSENMAVYAITSTHPVGVDIEKVECKFNQGIAERFFSREEYQFLKTLPESEQQVVFYQIWARKEALIKAIGAGLFMQLDAFTVAPQQAKSELITYTHDGQEAALQVTAFQAHPDYEAAFAISPAVKEIYYWQWLAAGPMAWAHGAEEGLN